MNQKTERPDGQIKRERLRAELGLPQLIRNMEKEGIMNENQNGPPAPENNTKRKLLRIETGYCQHATPF